MPECFLKTGVSGLERQLKSVKYVPCEHEDLSSSPHPRAYVKKQVWRHDV